MSFPSRASILKPGHSPRVLSIKDKDIHQPDRAVFSFQHLHSNTQPTFDTPRRHKRQDEDTIKQTGPSDSAIAFYYREVLPRKSRLLAASKELTKTSLFHIFCPAFFPSLPLAPDPGFSGLQYVFSGEFDMLLFLQCFLPSLRPRRRVSFRRISLDLCLFFAFPVSRPRVPRPVQQLQLLHSLWCFELVVSFSHYPRRTVLALSSHCPSHYFYLPSTSSSTALVR